MRRHALACLLALSGALLARTAAAEECDPRFLKSPQFIAEDCTFRNPPNPDAKPGLSSWQNWRRFLLQKKEGTVPVDPIPVRMLERAALEALDPAANHIIRLGH